MTEVCAGVTGTLDTNNEIGSVGVPFVKTTISIFNTETGKELKYGEIGEVCISGPNIMIGYYNNPQATAEIIKTHSDGIKWVHSGDLGYINENGSLFIIGRIKRMIIRYDGFKVFPNMIEDVINHSKKVKQSCAVSIQDPEHIQGKLPIVYAVLRDNANKHAVKTELTKLCENELPEYAQPVDFVFIDEMPLTPIGKVDYRALEKMAEESHT